MLYELHLQTKTNHKYKLTYDTVNNVLLKDDGRLLNIQNNSYRYLNGVDWFVEIVFGFNCNMNCTYCVQHKDFNKINTNIDYENLINKVSEYLSILDARNNSNIRLNGELCFTLWGGEPLLYFDTIKKIIPFIRKQYPKSTIGIPTNGLLLKDEIFEYISTNNISVGISHDGPGQYKLGADALKNPIVLENVKWMLQTQPKNIKFQPAISKFSKSYLDVVNYLKNILGTDQFQTNEARFITPMSDDVYNELCFTKDELKIQTKNLIKQLITNEIPQYEYAQQQADTWISRLGTPTSMKYPVNDNNIHNNFVVNIDGYLLQDHCINLNTVKDKTSLSNQYGNILTDNINSIIRPIPNTITAKYNKECINCLIYNCNDRGCSYRNSDFDYLCEIQQARIVAFIALALYKITDDILVEVIKK